MDNIVLKDFWFLMVIICLLIKIGNYQYNYFGLIIIWQALFFLTYLLLNYGALVLSFKVNCKSINHWAIYLNIHHT